MNRDLAKYIRSLKDEVSKNIWLDAISKSARNGTVNLIYKDILIENRITTKNELKLYFNPKEAEHLEIIKILVDTDSFISINFNKRTKQVAGASQVRVANREAKKELEITKAELLPAVQENKVKPPKEFLMEIPEKYTPSSNLVRAVIGDWILFYKKLQIDKAALVGKVLSTDEIANPNVSSEDVKHLKELCSIFSKQPNIKNEDQIKRCFHQVYIGWYNLDEFTQNGFTPRLIKSHINSIILQLQQHKNGKKSKRESAIDEKLSRAGQKDYSKLADSRKKNN